MSTRVAGVSLLDGEDVLHDMRPKWSTWFWTLILTGGLALPFVWNARRKTRYIVTTERVIHKRGGWSGTTTDEYRIEDIKQISTSRSFGEKRLGGGTIRMDTGPGELVFNAVPKHDDVVTTIREQQRQTVSA